MLCSCILGVGTVTSHLSRHHKDIWDAYVVDRDRKKNAKVERKLKEVVNCEMENVELRFTDLRSNAGQNSFLNQVAFMQLGSN